MNITSNKKLLSQHFGAGRDNGLIAWSPDGQYIARTGEGRIFVLDALSGESLYVYQHEKDTRSYTMSSPVNGLAWSPDSRFLVSGKHAEAYVWEALTGKQRLVYQGHAEGLCRAVWSPDGKRIATSSRDKSIQVWDAQTGQTLLKFEEHPTTVTHLAWSADSCWIISACRRRVLRWDSVTGALLNIYGSASDQEHTSYPRI